MMSRRRSGELYQHHQQRSQQSGNQDERECGERQPAGCGAHGGHEEYRGRRSESQT